MIRPAITSTTSDESGEHGSEVTSGVAGPGSQTWQSDELQRARRSGRPRGGPARGRSSAGSSSAQMSCAFQHRVRKRHPARRVDRARHIAREHDPLAAALPLRVAHGHRRQQRLRVRVARPWCRASSAGPISTILPRYITATPSEMWRTTERSWAMNRYASPSRSCRSSSRLTTPAWIDTSSADTGSSSTSTDGSSASARAMPTRWRCPPENSCG